MSSIALALVLALFLVPFVAVVHSSAAILWHLAQDAR